VGEAHVPAVMPFVDMLRTETRLQPAVLSKFEFGLLVAGIEPEASPRFGPTQVEPSVTVGEVAFAILRRNFAAFLAKEPGTRLDEDVEELHDMRVASRRLRAALALFADVLPIRAMPLREELGLVADALGAVRDLDVEIAQIGSWIELAEEPDRGPLGSLMKLLEDERDGARGVLLSTLDSKRYERLVLRFSALLHRGPLRTSPGSRMPAREAALELILPRFRKVREAARRLDARSDPTAYHRLRVRCKHLRYALEFFDDVYAGRPRAITRDLAELQEILGLHQDAYVAIARLRSMASSLGGEIGPAAAFAMGEVAERYRRGARRQRKRFPKAYRRFHGKRWRDFERLMERERTASLRSPPTRPAPRRSVTGAQA
jgi:CHAD domain-containing protein